MQSALVLVLPVVPEQGSGERVVPPGAAASSPLALNGHSVNPLKAHPSAAATGQRRARRWREGTAGWEGEKRRRTTTGSEKGKVQLQRYHGDHREQTEAGKAVTRTMTSRV